jgi:hypothetical protein
MMGKTATIKAPDSWDELPLRDMLGMYSMLFGSGWNEHSETTLTMVKLISIAKHLLNIDDGTLNLWEETCIAADPEHGQEGFLDELRQVVHAAIGGLFTITETENGATTYAIKYNLTKCPYPELVENKKDKRGKQIKKTVYMAPDDEFANMTMYEFARVMTLFDAYAAKGDDAIANQLIAVMYRRHKPPTRDNVASGYGGDKRLPLRGYESTIEERQKLIETTPLLVRRVILFWVASCRLKIVQQYPKVFKQGSEGSKGPNYGWGGVMLNLAGGPANLPDIADQNFHNSLVWLSMKDDEAKKMEEMMHR